MLIFATFGLAACGGGGGDGGGGNTNTPPSLTLIGANPLEYTVGDIHTDPGATVRDTQDGNSTVLGTGNVDTSTVGTYTLTYNHTDSGGMSAPTITRTVNVNAVANTPPSLALIGANPLEYFVNDTHTDPGATVTDAEDGTSTVMGTGTVDTSTAGSYTITYNHTDSGGLAAVAITRTVNVSIANTPPSLALIGANPMDLLLNDTFTDPGATVTDAEDGTSTVMGTGNVDTSVVGTYTLTYNHTDSGGLAAVAITRTVNVSSCGNDVNNNGECDNLETNKVDVVGITPRFVRFSNFAGTLFDVRARAVGVDLANKTVKPSLNYWTNWMSGGSGGISTVMLNDDMLDGDEVANDFDFRWKGFLSDVIMPASTIFADGAFNAQYSWFVLRDQNGDSVFSDYSLDRSFKVMLFRDDILEAVVEDVAPNVKFASDTAFFTYDGGLAGVGEQQVAQDFFTYFEDANIMVIANYESTTGNGNPDAGIISNDIGGLNLGIFDESSSWGSDGAFQLLIRQKDNMGWTVPHEVGHRWGFYPNEPVGISVPRGGGFHIALSNLQGQMAAAGFLDRQPNDEWLYTDDDGEGSFIHRVFSEWMQYLACDIPKEDVTSMWIINPDFEHLYSFGDLIPMAHMTEITIDDFTAIYGERSKVGDECQTVLSVVFVVVNRTRNPLTPDDFTGYNEQSKYLLGNSPGQGEVPGGLFSRSDMISLNAAMGAGRISFVNGLTRRSAPVASSNASVLSKDSQKPQISDESFILIEEPIHEIPDFSLLTGQDE